MKPMGYSCGRLGTNLQSDLPWLESLQLPSSPAGIGPFAARLWPDRPHAAADFRSNSAPQSPSIPINHQPSIINHQ
jgi:hypothetical protein